MTVLNIIKFLIFIEISFGFVFINIYLYIIEIDNNNSNNIVGFIVDTVEEVLEITENNIESSASVKTNSTKDKYIWGLGKVGDSVKILLDVRKILFEEDVKIMEEMSSQNKER